MFHFFANLSLRQYTLRERAHTIGGRKSPVRRKRKKKKKKRAADMWPERPSRTIISSVDSKAKYYPSARSRRMTDRNGGKTIKQQKIKKSGQRQLLCDNPSTQQCPRGSGYTPAMLAYAELLMRATCAIVSCVATEKNALSDDHMKKKKKK